MISANRACATAAAEGALEALGRRRELVNRLNVFPVPDGDTGTNMYLTVKAAYEAMQLDADSDADRAIADFARGALRGSRGNSGIILSQVLEGMAAEINDREPGVAELVRGLKRGVELAYRSVHNPVEGTMLTVVRETASGLSGEEPDLENLLEKAYRLAAASMMATPTMLPELARANVVDSGGAGLVAALEGMLEAVGLTAGAVDWDGLAPSGYTHDTTDSYHGPFTGVSFLLECDRESAQALEEKLARLGNSLVVAGTSSTFRMHIHTNFPEQVVDAAQGVGAVSDLNVVNFHDSLKGAASAGLSAASPSTVVAFSPGAGLSMLFESMGAITVPAGPGFQPSTGEVLDIIESHRDEVVVFLPNDADTLKVVEMALRTDGRDSRVIPTTSPLQGLAAMEDYIPDGEPGETVASMTRAASLVLTGKVARAVRDAALGPSLRVRSGQFIGFVEDSPMTVGPSMALVAESVCSELVSRGGATMVTVVSGRGVTDAEKEETVRRIGASLPGLDLDWHEGGQLHYQLLVGIMSGATPVGDRTD
jgi:hypothetical protein